MARLLTTSLDALMTTAQLRKPSWQVQIYDVRSTADTVGDVVIFNVTGFGSLALLTGPRDFTSQITEVSFREERGDYVNGGVQATTVQIDFVDPSGLLDPLLLIGVDPTSQAYQDSDARFLRQGNVVVIRVGDAQVPVSDWPYVFTGEIQGQSGRARSRSDGAVSEMSIRVASREARYLKYKRTSDEFTIGQSYLQAATSIAQDEMGLDLQEIDFANWGSQTFGHRSVQLIEESPLVMIAQLMFVDGVLPRFDGLGRLTQITSTITGSPDRVYGALDSIRRIDRPISTIEQPNCVTILGLEKTQTKVSQPLQRLATADVTTGYFANGEEIEVYWSEDKTLVADDVLSKVIKSVNGGLSILGGGEEFDLIPAPGPGGGSVGVIITIDTGFAPWLVVFLLVTYLVLAAIPDDVLVAGVAGVTIPIGRIIQALALGAALFIMTKIGRGQYEFHGSPFEYVYKEIRAQACVQGKGPFDENQVTIENHLVNTKADARNLARETLFLLQAEENPREVEMLHDLRLEPDDIFEIPGGRSFLIDTVSYSLRRDDDSAIATLEVFEVTPGVLP